MRELNETRAAKRNAREAALENMQNWMTKTYDDQRQGAHRFNGLQVRSMITARSVYVTSAVCDPTSCMCSPPAP